MIRLKQVRGRTGLSRSSIYGLIARGLFPRQVVLVPGGRSVGWLDDEITDFLVQRIAQRSA